MPRITSIAAALAVVLLTVFLLTGCGQSAEAQAQGRYELDRERALADVQAQIDALEEGSQERAEMEMFVNFIDDMSITLELREEGVAEMSMSMMGMTDDNTGTWTIDGETIAITDEAGETVTGTLRDKVLELDLDGDEDEAMPFSMVLRRVEE